LFASRRQHGCNFDEGHKISDPHGQTTLMAIVPLYLSCDRLALETHFAALNDEDLHYRFCGSIKPAGVMRYLDQLNGTAAHSYGIFNSSLALVAVCQLVQSAGDLEVGISVLAPFRRKGFAIALLDHSARYARARGLKALTIHSLANNTSMLSLVRRIGMSVEILEGEADGRLRLRADTIIRREVAYDQQAIASELAAGAQFDIGSRSADGGVKKHSACSQRGRSASGDRVTDRRGRINPEVMAFSGARLRAIP
jgi:GNAT superfamily N-acetyltransferase